jgi:hypothetical protein
VGEGLDVAEAELHERIGAVTQQMYEWGVKQG